MARTIAQTTTRTTAPPAAGAKRAHFGAGLFEFLRELESNNNRAWFDANRSRYEREVQEPMLAFIVAFGEWLPEVSARFVADPRRVGGSMFRIYRDTRFSKDKRPFKTAAAAQFPHQGRGKDRSVPAFYLHLSPELCIGGGGMYHPDAAALKQVRDRIVAKPEEWQSVLRTKISIEGDALKRPPRGYDAGHAFIEDLKRKDFYTMTRFTERQVSAPDFLDAYVEACARASPLVAFVTRALGLRW